MAADIEDLLDQAASRPKRQLDLGALHARRRRRRGTRRVLGVGAALIVVALAVVILPRLTSPHVVFEPADQPADTTTTAPRDGDDAGVPEPARPGDVIATEGVPVPASDVNAP